MKKKSASNPILPPLYFIFFFSHVIFHLFFSLKCSKTTALHPFILPPTLLLLSCQFVPRVADKRNCANESLKSLNGSGLLTMGQRMQSWTKAGPCPTIPPCGDGSERTHERGLDLRLRGHHLTPHWANQKGMASGIH